MSIAEPTTQPDADRDADRDADPGVAWLSDVELADALLVADRARSVAEARELELLGEFDARKGFAVDGALNAAGWLACRGDICRSAAGSMVSDARRLRRHPESMRACSRIGTGRVRAFISRVNDRTEPAYVANETDVLGWIARLSVDDTIRYARRWNQVHDTDGPEPAEEKPSLSTGRSGGGLFGRLSLFGDDAALFSSLLEDEVDAIYRTETDDDHLDPTHRRALALMNLLRKASGADDRYTNPARPTVIVHMTLDDLEKRGSQRIATIEPWNQPMSPESVQRLLCDAELHRFLTGPGSVVIDLGYSERLVKGYQRLAVIARDRCCQFPGCDRPPSMCQIHHIVPWEDGGPTDMPNLVLLCHRHHHSVHGKPGTTFTCKRLKTGHTQFRRPDGTILQPHPPPDTPTG